jgi:hypothetical protein
LDIYTYSRNNLACCIENWKQPFKILTGNSSNSV